MNNINSQSTHDNFLCDNGVWCRGEAPTQNSIPLPGEGVGGGDKNTSFNTNLYKIAFIIRMYQEKAFHGGGEKLFYNLIKRFQQDGHDIMVYCAESNAKSVPVTLVDAEYDHNAPQSMEIFYDKAKELIAQEHYDFVISENITPPVDITFLQGHSLVNRLKKTKNPIEAFLYNFRKTKKQRINYQQKWMKQGYRKIFVVSELLKEDIVENFGVEPEKIAVIYPGVDLPGFEKPTEKSEVPVFGLLAPGFKIKGGFIFLKALSILKKRGYKFKARIIYPKHQKNLGVNLLVKLYNIEKEVEFISFQQDITAFYKSLDCLVVPSVEDTFNLAALEAMACAKPVIISNSAGACEIINEGVNGFVFDMKNNLLTLSGKEFGDIKALKEYRKKASEYYHICIQGKYVKHKKLGEILFAKSGRKESVSKTLQSVNLFPKLLEIIQNAEYLRTENPNHLRKDGITKFHILKNKVKINGIIKHYEFLIAEDQRGKKFYCIKDIINEIPVGRYRKTITGTNEYINNITCFCDYFNPSKNLASKLMFYIDNPQLHEKLEKESRQTAEKYSWDRVFQRTIEEIAGL